MLNILRKYQKFIFAIITVVIVISFSFFGTYGSITAETQVPDKEIGKAIDGSIVMKNEINHLVAILNTDSQDMMVLEGKGGANLLNDGVVRQKIIQNGLIRKIFEAYSEEIKVDLEGKFARFKKFKPYVHPDKIFGVESALKQFMPSFAADFENFKKSGDVLNGEVIELLGKLYVNQAAFPPKMMRQILLFQQNQYNQFVRPDPNLMGSDLSLFYAKTLTDWFGSRFVNLMAQFIHNAAVYANNKGYKVTKGEAKSSLMQIGMDNLKQIEKDREITAQEFNQFFQGQLRAMGMTETDAISAWQKVLLFKKLFGDVEEGIIVDSKLYTKFHEYASQGASVDLYRLPKNLNIQSQNDLDKLEVYLEAVAEKTDEALPTKFLTPQEVMKTTPQLLWKRFLISAAKVSRKEIESEVGLRITWNWEIEDRNWKRLVEKFPVIAKSNLSEREKRFAYLESLDQKVRNEIDKFARERMVIENPEWIKEKLAKAESKKQEVRILFEGDKEILPGIKDRKRILSLLEKGPLTSQEVTDDSVREELYCYSEDGDIFYRIRIYDRTNNFEILSFKQANELKILDQLLEDREIKNPNKDRLVLYMQKMKQKILLGEDVLLESKIKGVQDETLENLDPLEEQWKIEKETLKITRKMDHPLFSEELFQEKIGQWSKVAIDKRANPYFYHINDKFVDTDQIANAMKEGRKLLGTEAVKELLAQILDEMKSKNVISFSQGEDDGFEDTSTD